jgi:hypothetical protein
MSNHKLLLCKFALLSICLTSLLVLFTQFDEHNANMTVAETMEFSYACQCGSKALKRKMPEHTLESARLVLSGEIDESRREQRSLMETSSEVIWVTKGWG